MNGVLAMATNSYQIYFAEVTTLAKTMVIKSDISAEATNKYFRSLGLTVSSDRRTWRYYMNIAGLYHSTDVPMIVRSSDTREDIEFTVANLAIHRATAREYRYGTRKYRQLVERFPGQVSLIRGILNPVDIDVAIAAEEGEILWMDESLIDSNETNLKDLIQRQINSFIDRWHVDDYSRIEELYDPARLAILYVNLPNFILNARLQNCHTIYVCEFHIRQYLASNGRLDVFMDYMTKRQQLFFYRNLPYLHRYPGHTDTFKWLIQRVLEERGFPIAKYEMVHNVLNMPDDLDPSIELFREEMLPAWQGTEITAHSVFEVLSKEAPLALNNPNYISEHEAITTDKMVLAKNSKVSTKVLESKIVDRSDSQVFRLVDTLINHWVYLAHSDRFRSVVMISNPRTGEDISLSMLDAFILYIYAYNRAVNVTLPIVPNLDAIHVRKIPKPSVDEMMSVVDARYVDRNAVVELWDSAPPVQSYVSIPTFYEDIYAVFKSSVEQYRFVAYHGHHLERGMLESATDFMYQNINLNLAGEMSYPVWLKQRNLEELEEFGQLEMDDLWINLLNAATGLDQNLTISLTDIHRAMVGIMSRLSSYSVQFVRDINSEPLKPIPVKMLRLGDTKSSVSRFQQVDVHRFKLLRDRARHRARHDVSGGPGSVGVIGYKHETRAEREVVIPFGVTNYSGYRYEGRVELPTLRIKPYPYQDPVDLTSLLVKDWSDVIIEPIGVIYPPLSSIVNVNQLDGLYVPSAPTIPLNTIIETTELDGLYVPELSGTPLSQAVSMKTMSGFRPEGYIPDPPGTVSLEHFGERNWIDGEGNEWIIRGVATVTVTQEPVRVGYAFDGRQLPNNLVINLFVLATVFDGQPAPMVGLVVTEDGDPVSLAGGVSSPTIDDSFQALGLTEAVLRDGDNEVVVDFLDGSVEAATNSTGKGYVRSVTGSLAERLMTADLRDWTVVMKGNF